MVVSWDLMGFTLCESNMAGWKIPELNGGLNSKIKSPINGGFSIAVPEGAKK